MARAQRVDEMQGLYGPFTFSEKLLQQIWARGDFDRTALATTDGRRLQVLHPGRWNFLGGPDFREARLRFDDGPVVTGDVELHLRARDWVAHRHAADPAYDGVRLHVVLFPEGPGVVTVGAGSRLVPTLALLPRLHDSLEDYAAEAAIEALAGRPLNRVLDSLRLLAPESLEAELRSRGEARWRQKVHFARLRIERLGWTEACHHAALEILGYRFNRAPMLRVAACWPLRSWQAGVDEVEAMYRAEMDHWRTHGVRPANLPRARLRQYATWVSAVPDWPEILERVGAKLPVLDGGRADTADLRRQIRLGAWREMLAQDICGDSIGGTRLDNLVCDGWLPLLSAHAGWQLSELWWHWVPGDQPPAAVRALRELGVFDGRSRPACQGPVQGLMGCILAQETAGL